ncbi:hypothetical protein D1007_10465 [Hordeum vulgare]|nr:hypothetical protein D1007_10465 [Hordeum vulgare]
MTHNRKTGAPGKAYSPHSATNCRGFAQGMMRRRGLGRLTYSFTQCGGRLGFSMCYSQLAFLGFLLFFCLFLCFYFYFIFILPFKVFLFFKICSEISKNRIFQNLFQITFVFSIFVQK